MVDPVAGTGAIPGVGANKTQSQNNGSRKAEDASGSRTIEDNVNISSEALSLQEVQQAVTDIRKQLQNSGLTLGLNPQFLGSGLIKSTI